MKVNRKLNKKTRILEIHRGLRKREAMLIGDSNELEEKWDSLHRSMDKLNSYRDSLRSIFLATQQTINGVCPKAGSISDVSHAPINIMYDGLLSKIRLFDSYIAKCESTIRKADTLDTINNTIKKKDARLLAQETELKELKASSEKEEARLRENIDSLLSKINSYQDRLVNKIK